MTDPVSKSIATDSLGFPLKVVILVGEFAHDGTHVTYENEAGEVKPDAEHRIQINAGLADADLAEIASHEVYHLFYSIRHLITADEKTECQVFGQLVKRVHAAALGAEYEEVGTGLYRHVESGELAGDLADPMHPPLGCEPG